MEEIKEEKEENLAKVIEWPTLPGLLPVFPF
jgi:hypothetical protein